MNDKFFTAIDNILYGLNATLEELDLAPDELFAYAKKYNFNRDELESFIKQHHKMSQNKPQKVNLTEADYMEILRAKRAASASGRTNYADGTVFYKGKALGRCPAGTTRSGKTCVPGAGTTPMAPGYKTSDLGGLSRAQVQALSKARSTEDIIKAHKKSNKQ
jgi:proline racemase